MNYQIDQNTDFSSQKQIILDNLGKFDLRDLTGVVDISLRMFAEEIMGVVDFDGDSFTLRVCNILDDETTMNICDNNLEESFTDYIGGDKDENDKVINSLKQMVKRVEAYARNQEARFEARHQGGDE